MILNKRNITDYVNSLDISKREKMDLFRDLMSKLKVTKPYNVTVKIECNNHNLIYTISYKADKFGIVELSNTELHTDYTGGNGKKYLCKEPHLSYSYIDNTNIYILTYDSNEYECTHQFKETLTFEVKNDMLSILDSIVFDTYHLEQRYALKIKYMLHALLLEEIFSNILYHTNIEIVEVNINGC